MNLKTVLLSQVKKKRLSHAYLVFEDFSIETVAKILEVNAPDLFVLEERPIKINHIREIIRYLSLKPHSSCQKLVIILDIENLTLEAANALLKVLEEPPAHSILILKAGQKEKILPTVSSRCQVINQKTPIKPGLDEDWLKLKELAQKSIKERFDYAAEIIKKEDLLPVLNFWEKELRERLCQNQDVLAILNEICHLRSLLSRNVSLKLHLENLLLRF